ncbi:hypothetical protein Moror_8746, partial [Moniliophthora roreri MCA 2997]
MAPSTSRYKRPCWATRSKQHNFSSHPFSISLSIRLGNLLFSVFTLQGITIAAITIDLAELKKTLSNAHKFLPEKALLGIVVDNFCCEAFNSLAGLSDDNMLAVSKNCELVELCIAMFKEVTNSSVQSVIDDQVCKSVSDNVLYIEQLADGTCKPDKSAPAEPAVCPIKAKCLTKAEVEDFLTDNKKSSEEEPALHTRSHRKGKEKAPAKTEKHICSLFAELLFYPKSHVGYQVKDPKDNVEPCKADHKACRPDCSSHSNSVPPAMVDMDTVMA